MSGPDGSPRRYEDPKWPTDEPSVLEMLGHGAGALLGPCTAKDWSKGEDGEWLSIDPYGSKPVVLRVRSQTQHPDGPLILQANDGSISDMDYAVWTRALWDKYHPDDPVTGL